MAGLVPKSTVVSYDAERGAEYLIVDNPCPVKDDELIYIPSTGDILLVKGSEHYSVYRKRLSVVGVDDGAAAGIPTAIDAGETVLILGEDREESKEREKKFNQVYDAVFQSGTPGQGKDYDAEDPVLATYINSSTGETEEVRESSPLQGRKADMIIVDELPRPEREANENMKRIKDRDYSRNQAKIRNHVTSTFSNVLPQYDKRPKKRNPAAVVFGVVAGVCSILSFGIWVAEKAMGVDVIAVVNEYMRGIGI